MSANPREEIEIDLATQADVDAIYRLEREAFSSPWRRDFFDSELRGSGRFNLVAKKKGRVVGYVFSMWFFDEMHVNKIAVDERLRRTGIAWALMRRCAEFARANGIKTISLEVRKTNEGAVEFYRVLGFAEAYVRPRYYPDGEAAVVMTKVLEP